MQNNEKLPEQIFEIRDIIRVIPSNPEVMEYIKGHIRQLRQSDKYDIVTTVSAATGFDDAQNDAKLIIQRKLFFKDFESIREEEFPKHLTQLKNWKASPLVRDPLSKILLGGNQAMVSLFM